MTDYELWSWVRLSRYPGAGALGQWRFHGYRRLSLTDVLKYEAFGYCVRKVIGDRSSTIPLFPVLGRTGSYPVDGVD